MNDSLKSFANESDYIDHTVWITHYKEVVFYDMEIVSVISALHKLRQVIHAVSRGAYFRNNVAALFANELFSHSPPSQNDYF